MRDGEHRNPLRDRAGPLSGHHVAAALPDASHQVRAARIQPRPEGKVAVLKAEGCNADAPDVFHLASLSHSGGRGHSFNTAYVKCENPYGVVLERKVCSSRLHPLSCRFDL